MRWSKMSPEELEAERQKLHDSAQERGRKGLRAIEEMSKHPLSTAQKRAQMKRIAEAAEKESQSEPE